MPRPTGVQWQFGCQFGRGGRDLASPRRRAPAAADKPRHEHLNVNNRTRNSDWSERSHVHTSNTSDNAFTEEFNNAYNSRTE